MEIVHFKILEPKKSSETNFFTVTFGQSTLIYSAHLLNVSLDLDGEYCAVTSPRPLGRQQKVLATDLNSLDSGTVHKY